MHRTILSRILPAAISFLLLVPPFLEASSNSTTGATVSKETLVRRRLAELFELCRARDYVQAASYLVYRGDEKRRNWKDIYNYNNRDEQPPVEGVCTKIRDLLHGCDGQEYGSVRIEKESEGEWVALTVTFRKAGERTTLTFAFLKIKGKYCLGDIDTD
jgi:hypothetical protein